MTRQTGYVKRNTEVYSCKHCRNGKAISITYSENVFVALGIKYAKFMRCKNIYFHLGAARLYHIFPHYLTKGSFFLGGGVIIDPNFFFLQCLSEKFLILRRVQRDIAITDPTGYAACSHIQILCS